MGAFPAGRVGIRVVAAADGGTGMGGLAVRAWGGATLCSYRGRWRPEMTAAARMLSATPHSATSKVLVICWARSLP